MTYAEFKALEDAVEAAYRSLMRLTVNVDRRYEAVLRNAYEDAVEAHETAAAVFQED
jgi:hypothetical protein